MPTILDRIQARLNEFTKKERNVATAVLSNPGQTVTETIAQLARRAQVSEPSVTRFCQKLGAEGYPDFKLELAKAVNHEQQREMDLVSTGDTPTTIARKVISNTMQALKELGEGLCGSGSDTDIKAVSRCMDLIAQARRIVIVAQGLSVAVGLDFHTRLAWIGVPSELYHDPSLMMMHTTTLRTGELMMAISATGSNRDVIAAALNAKESGAVVVGLCPARTHLSDSCTWHLPAPASAAAQHESMMVGRTVMHTILQIVLEGVMLRRADISELSQRLQTARARSYFEESGAAGEPLRKHSPNQSIEPNAPIVPFKWPPSGAS